MYIKTPNDGISTSKPEKFTQKSLTIPDQAMSIPELIRRYASGLPLGGQRVPLYSEEPETDFLNGRNWETLDISEQYDFMKYAKDEINDINKRIQDTKQQKLRENNEKSTTNEEQ